MWCHSWKWNKASHIGEFESKRILEIPLGNFLGMPCEVKCKISTSLPPALWFSENYLEPDSLPTKHHCCLSHTQAHPPTLPHWCVHTSLQLCPGGSWEPEGNAHETWLSQILRPSGTLGQHMAGSRVTVCGHVRLFCLVYYLIKVRQDVLI